MSEVTPDDVRQLMHIAPKTEHVVLILRVCESWQEQHRAAWEEKDKTDGREVITKIQLEQQRACTERLQEEIEQLQDILGELCAMFFHYDPVDGTKQCVDCRQFGLDTHEIEHVGNCAVEKAMAILHDQIKRENEEDRAQGGESPGTGAFDEEDEE